MNTRDLILSVNALFLMACSDHISQPGSDSSSSVEQQSSSSEHLSSAVNPSSNSLSSSGTQSSSSSTIPTPATLFTTRIPTSKDLTCTGSSTQQGTFEQADWICSLDYKSLHGFFYMQNTPTSCTVMMSATPVYSTDTAAFYSEGSLKAVDSASYEFGGNHNNDYIQMTYQGHVFRYYHSSFGFGWRKCQPMDCLQVYEADGSTLIEDGCTSERTLPVVCRMANSDGSFDSFADDFSKCYGDL